MQSRWTRLISWTVEHSYIMSTPSLRMAGCEGLPSDVEARVWIGETHLQWLQVTELVDRPYAGIFAAERERESRT